MEAAKVNLKNGTMIEFTPDKLRRLKVLYGRAKANGEESFMFDGHELLVAYAKYLIEYLEMKFSGKEVK